MKVSVDNAQATSEKLKQQVGDLKRKIDEGERTAVTPEIMATMLASDNGVSTSSFQLYDAGSGKVTVTLNNFCKIQNMGPEDEDDILSCVHFLLVDVMTARRVLGGLSA